ncbi:subunit of tubulin prefoldin [Coelomomyces lativittatus]|nr:subunit of tubulin prefoldin [Coelomomyces lativittatus]KAJ1518465.1 subunit of tubulin prefoldin [Coelomomyces lativittatus]
MSQPPPSSSSSSSSPSFPTSPLLSSTSSSSSSTTTPRRENIVDISELEVPQLESIHQQLQEELQVLTQSYAQLKQVQLKFLNCDETLASLMECKQDRPILVPLTNSLYVPGHLVKSRVMMDIGTGYYVEKSYEQARSYYQRREQHLQSHLLPLQSTLQTKQNNIKTVVETMQGKWNEEKQRSMKAVVSS